MLTPILPELIDRKAATKYQGVISDNSIPTPLLPELMDRKTAAKYLGVAPDTLSVWACTKRYPLKRIKIGRSVRYRRSDLDAFLQERLCS
ncbi:hypothetical protein BWI96_10475 [Siphonobacter sp. SORGH_AS_0500]|uniref:helix-turn-helix transcriptional regulator n=1 Tax=Siphonobacter sp. SORGH_AS_0500 TaxID=1864824 RepID=UPI000CB92260|nr:helix-turn-helix domain-containing protein [Siphonobacter sp. SORGH_AS_0500]PKK36787.1 hypothetical protein BWI96_10475 [Siphonobacter sp. SORGH_AS_0500]